LKAPLITKAADDDDLDTDCKIAYLVDDLISFADDRQ
jgi:hypothetical protein